MTPLRQCVLIAEVYTVDKVHETIRLTYDPDKLKTGPAPGWPRLKPASASTLDINVRTKEA